MVNDLERKDILLIKAREDFETAKNLIRLPDFSEEIVLFHCQQAIEKALKAYLDSISLIYPKSHDLEMLLSLCIEKDTTFNQISYVTSFTPYAVEIRYDEIIELPQGDVINTVNQTEEALNFIISKI
jgi:HEPN domain-containing protein